MRGRRCSTTAARKAPLCQCYPERGRRPSATAAPCAEGAPLPLLRGRRLSTTQCYPERRRRPSTTAAPPCAEGASLPVLRGRRHSATAARKAPLCHCCAEGASLPLVLSAAPPCAEGATLPVLPHARQAPLYHSVLPRARRGSSAIAALRAEGAPLPLEEGGREGGSWLGGCARVRCALWDVRCAG